MHGTPKNWDLDIPPPKKQHPTRITADEERKVMLEFTCLCICVWTSVYVNAQTQGLTCIPVSSSLPAAPTFCPPTDHPEPPILIPRTSLFPSLTDLPSPLTPASLLKLGAPVITALSSAQLLYTPHSTLLIPLSSCPRFSSQSSASSMNIAELVYCQSALWFYSIPTCD